MAPTNDIVKDKADEHTRHIVEGRRRRQVASDAKDEREVDILEEIDPELLVAESIEIMVRACRPGKKKRGQNKAAHARKGAVAQGHPTTIQ